MPFWKNHCFQQVQEIDPIQQTITSINNTCIPTWTILRCDVGKYCLYLSMVKLVADSSGIILRVLCQKQKLEPAGILQQCRGLSEKTWRGDQQKAGSQLKRF